ncbi:MAG: transposase [Spirochaetes bacterium]|nr:transposase [Spirochaetota bacterium]
MSLSDDLAPIPLLGCPIASREPSSLEAGWLPRPTGWLEHRQGQIPSSMMLGKAIGYTLRQWSILVRHLDSSILAPDNHTCEQAIRPSVVGRKNWPLAGSPAGAEAGAGWYSFILSHLADGESPEAFRDLLPSRRGVSLTLPSAQVTDWERTSDGLHAHDERDLNGLLAFHR